MGGDYRCRPLSHHTPCFPRFPSKLPASFYLSPTATPASFSQHAPFLYFVTFPMYQLRSLSATALLFSLQEHARPVRPTVRLETTEYPTFARSLRGALPTLAGARPAPFIARSHKQTKTNQLACLQNSGVLGNRTAESPRVHSIRNTTISLVLFISKAAQVDPFYFSRIHTYMVR